VQGPEVKLSVAHIQTLGLALHELATNAMKHGALHEEAGHVEITWAVEHNQQGANTLALNWHESGLSTPPDSSRRGFGRHMIERALVHTMRATTGFHFRQDGITCRIAIPIPTESDPLR
jgi:two-component system CheB/CheR fusion protein